MDLPDYTRLNVDELPNSIIHSPSFTFLVGPKHTKLTIQSGLAQHVSKPLHNLMNNGHTRESKHRIAVLEDEDVETFVAFCEYAYTGDYKVPRLPPREDVRQGVVETALSPVNSWRGTYRSASVSSTIPPPAPSPPESVKSSETTALALVPAPAPAPASVKPEPEPTPAFEEARAGEIAAEAEAVEQKVAAEEDKTNDESAVPVESEEIPLDQGQDTDATAPGEDAVEVIPEPTADAGEWGTLEESPPEVSTKKKKGKKGKKIAKNKMPVEQEPWTEEPAANLTPPSTPPPANPVEVHDIPEEVLPEPNSEGEEEAAEAETITEPEEKEVGPEASADDLPEKVETEPAPDDWEQPAYAEDDGQDPEESWANDDEVEKQSEIQFSKPIIDMSFAKQHESSPRTPGLSLWDAFSALQYNNEKQNPQPPVDSKATDLPYLTFHAKVYVFATRYLIPTLSPTLSVADTESLDPFSGQNLGGLAASQAPIILDLLRYVYTKTTRLEPINPTSATQLRENELRRLVVHYAACKVKDLAQYHSPGDSEAATPTLRPVDKGGASQALCTD
ncbi:uncharacterized protein N7477_004763 [Penicillium maclennaniae]|uniref:uncharacterized protein n=1 Tax=Penicillium maclennaniae TaxID=1343394 RepID=UPI002541773B|nr:uncharacterized protein N7477_004763 [Penicillium maclennaniae]KAJ5674829.1 hypothetical protein N7477_004763 [Penicillium maclennaniae]